eukprot:jgi/Bigna1/136776/aug1.35_g11484
MGPSPAPTINNWTLSLGYELYGGTTIADTEAQFSDVVTDMDGNTYAAGFASGDWESIDVVGSDTDCIIMSTDVHGALRWRSHEGVPGQNTRCTSLAMNGTRHVYIVGSSDGPIDGEYQGEQNTSRALLLKYDADSGARVWLRLLGVKNSSDPSLQTHGKAVAVDNRWEGGDQQQYVYVGGETTAHLDGSTHPLPGWKQIFIAKYSANSSLLWTRVLNSSSTTLLEGLEVDSEGNVYLGGQSKGDVVHTSFGGGASNCLIGKLSSDGNDILWMRMIGTKQSTIGTGLALDSSRGALLVVGTTQDPQTFPNIRGTRAGFLLRVNTSTGQVRWNSTLHCPSCVIDARGVAWKGPYIFIVGDLPSGSTRFGFCSIFAFDGKFRGSNTASANGSVYFDSVAASQGNTAIVAGKTNSEIRSSSMFGGRGYGSMILQYVHYQLTQAPTNSPVTSSPATLSPSMASWNGTFMDTRRNLYTEVTGVVHTPNGDQYLSAWATTATVPTRIGNEDCFLQKVSSTGDVVWTKQLGVVDKETRCASIAYDTSSNALYAVGTTNGSLNSEAQVGHSSLFLVKFDGSDGSLSWTKLLGVHGYKTEGVAVLVDGSLSGSGTNEIFVLGATTGEMGPEQLATPTGKSSFLAARFKADSTQLWAQSFPLQPEVNYIPKAIVLDRLGNAYCGGQTAINATYEYGSFWKILGNGTVVWSRRVGVGIGLTSVDGLAYTREGGEKLYITGTTNLANFYGDTLSGNMDTFIGQCDMHGMRIWTKLLGGSTCNTCSSRASAISISGWNIYVAGDTDGSGTLHGKSRIGISDVFLSTFTRDSGQFRGLVLAGVDGEEARANALSFVPNFHYVIAGRVGNTTSQTNGTLFNFYNKMTTFSPSSSPTPSPTTKSPTLSSTITDGDDRFLHLVGASNKESKAKSVTMDDNDFMYSLGISTGNISGQTESGNTVCVLEKYNVSGALVWTRLYSAGVGSDTKCLKVAWNSNSTLLYITGFTTGAFNGIAGMPINQNDMVIFSVNRTNGNIIASSQEGPSALSIHSQYTYARGVDVVFAPNSQYIYIVGILKGRGLPSFHGISVRGYDDWNGFVAKVNINNFTDWKWANEIWSKSASQDGNAIARGIALDSNGESVYVVGDTSLSLFEQYPLSGGGDFFLIKYHSNNGSICFVATDGPISATAQGQDVVIDDDDNVYVIGSTTGNFLGQSLSGAIKAAFLAKYTPSGTRLWGRYTTPESGKSIVPRGGVYVPQLRAIYFCGGTDGFNTLPLTSPTLTSQSPFIAHYDLNGNEAGFVSFAAEATTFIDVAISPDIKKTDGREVFLTGWTESNYSNITITGSIDIILQNFVWHQLTSSPSLAPSSFSPTTCAPSTTSPATFMPSASPSTGSPSIAPGTIAPTLTPPPHPTDSWFQDDFARISVAFSSDTNAEATNCTELLSHTTLLTLGERTEVACRWEAPALLEITLGSKPTIMPNDTIMFAPNILVGITGSKQVTPVGVRVRQATNLPFVSVTVSGPLEIGACDVLAELTASAQGSAGRPMRYQWQFLGPDLVSPEATRAVAAAINATTSDILRIKVTNMTFGQTYRVSLEMGRGAYHFTLQAESQDANGQIVGKASVTFTVNLESEAVVAFITGGDDRLIDVVSNPTIQFDASPSVDLAYPNIPPAVYAWEVYRSMNNGVKTLVLASNGTASVLTLPQYLLFANTVYEVAVVATGRFNRSGQDTQRVTTTAIPVPQVSIELRSEILQRNSNKVNSGKKIVFRGQISANLGQLLEYNTGNFLWKYKLSASSDSVASSSSDVFNNLEQTMLQSPWNGSYLVLRPSVLAPGAGYTFQLEVAMTHLSQTVVGRAAVFIQTNAPPSLGICNASPVHGVALTTTFRLFCSGWTDVDLPLLYKFQTLDEDSGLALDLSDFRELPHYDTVLPGSKNGTLVTNATGGAQTTTIWVSALVQDAFGAEASRNFTVGVSQPFELNLANAESLLQKRLDEGDTQNFVVIAVGTSTYLAAKQDQINQTESEATRKNLLSILRQAVTGNVSTRSNYGGSTSTTNGTISQISPVNSAALVSSITNFVRAGEIDDFQTQALAVGILRDVASTPKLALIGIDHSIAAVSNLVSSSAEALRDNNTATKRMAVNVSQDVADVLSSLSQRLVSQNVPGEDIISTSSRTKRLVKVNIDCQKLSLLGAQGRILRSRSSVAEVQIPSKLSSYIAVEGDTLYPYPPAPPKSVVASFESADVIFVEIYDTAGQKIPINNLTEGQRFRFTVPGNNLNLTRAREAGLSARPLCGYWNISQKGWRVDGMTAIPIKSNSTSSSGGRGDTMEGGGGITCESSHLTAFHARMDFSVEVNTLTISDIEDTRSLDPAHNPMAALVVGNLCVLLVFMVVARIYDLHIMRRSDVDRLEKKFWRETNMQRSHRISERSWYKWRYSLKWNLRRRHTWISMCFRPHGDYINSQKRVITLAVLLFNSATVCALLIGTEQELPFLGEDASIALVAAVLSFPVPYVFGLVFLRAPPKSLRVQLKDTAVAVGVVSWLMCCMNLCANMNGEAIEGEVEGLEEGEDQDDYDDNQYVEEEEKEDDDDNDNDEFFTTNSFLATSIAEESAATMERAVAAVAAIQATSSVRGRKARTRPKSIYKERRSRKRRIGRSANKMPLGSLASSTTSSVAHMPRRWIKKSEMSSYQWSKRDCIGIALAAIIVTGCSFLLMVLAWSLYGKSWEVVHTTLQSFAQDILGRLLVLFFIDTIIMAPLCCLCCLDGEKTDRKRNSSGLYSVEMSCDIPSVRYDENLHIVHLHPEAKGKGLVLGHRITHINSKPVETFSQCKKALKVAHGMNNTFIMTLEDPNKNSDGAKRGRGKGASARNGGIGLSLSRVLGARESDAKNLQLVEMVDLKSKAESKTKGHTGAMSSVGRVSMIASYRHSELGRQSFLSKEFASCSTVYGVVFNILLKKNSTFPPLSTSLSVCLGPCTLMQKDMIAWVSPLKPLEKIVRIGMPKPLAPEFMSQVGVGRLNRNKSPC